MMSYLSIMDDVHRKEGKSPGALQMLNTRGNIFLGGGPEGVTSLTGGRFSTALTGCFHTLSFEQKKIDFESDSLSSANILPCSE